MKLTKSFTSFALIFSLSLFSFLSLSVQTADAQDARIALQRGYRTGYSDGYMAGYRDVIDNAAKVRRATANMPKPTAPSIRITVNWKITATVISRVLKSDITRVTKNARSTPPCRPS
jgi:hypothetical protein